MLLSLCLASAVTSPKLLIIIVIPLTDSMAFKVGFISSKVNVDLAMIACRKALCELLYSPSS